MQLTPLGYALIGLTLETPQTGYALRQIFSSSPLALFSSSPGSIYPALKKLVDAGYLHRKTAPGSAKPLYYVTDSGEKILVSWLRQPVSLSEIATDVDKTLLRFAFLQSINDDGVTRDFLISFQNAVSEHLANLETFMQNAEGQALSQHGRLAMENGILGYKSQLDWAKSALMEFST